MWRPSLKQPIPCTLLLAVVFYVFIPYLNFSRESARFTQCRNNLKQWSSPYFAHTIVVDQNWEIVRVDSKPLFPGEDMEGDSIWEYAFFLQDGNEQQKLLEYRAVPVMLFEDAQHRVRALRQTPEFRHRQGRITTIYNRS